MTSTLGNCYVVTAQQWRQICDVTNAGVGWRSERGKHPSRCTVVKLTTAYLTMVTDL